MDEGIIVAIGFFATIVGITYLFLSTRHRERMALIEKGQNAKLFYQGSRRGQSLKLGLLAVGVAFGLIVGEMVSREGGFMEEGMAHFAFSFLFGGISLIIYFLLEPKVIRREREEERDLQG